MLKRTIKYKNFDDVEKEGVFYFNLSKPEILDMAIGDDLSSYFQKMMDDKDNAAILNELKKLILAAYGERSADGDYFEKSEEISERFLRHAAYEALFMEIMTDPDAMLNFFIGTLPSDMQGQIKESTQKALSEAEAQYKNTPQAPPMPPTS